MRLRCQQRCGGYWSYWSYWSYRSYRVGAIHFLSALLFCAAASAQPCPRGSAERPFRQATDLGNCVAGQVSGNPAGARYNRYYDFYCPGRMTVDDAIRVGARMVEGSSTGGNRIEADYTALGLVPQL